MDYRAATSLSETEGRARDLARTAGVTRLADITGYDRIGMPVWQAIRPQSRSLSVGLGRGASRAQARVSALMETLELHVAETVTPDLEAAPTTAEVSQWRLAGDGCVQWLEGRDLLSGRRARAPYRLVSMDNRRPRGAGPSATSTGLAGGPSLRFARRAALAELVERHAMHRFDAAPHALRRTLRFEPAAFPDRRVRWLLGRVARAGCGVLAFDLSSFAGVPVVAAMVLDGGAHALNLPPALGICCRERSADALFGAMSEAVQARAGLVAGARDDLSPAQYGNCSEAVMLLAISSYSEACTLVPKNDVQADPESALLQGLSGAGAACVVELLLFEQPGLCFVKLLAPGIADWVPE